jgi:hypothetical protein
MNPFDQALKGDDWPLLPKAEVKFATSHDPCLNAALAISLCAYPQSHQITKNGKAAKYYFSLLAYLARIEKMQGYADRLPEWAKNVKPRNMQSTLDTGVNHLRRSLVIRSVIFSALFDSIQNRNAKSKMEQSFSFNFNADLVELKMEFPLEKTGDHYRHVGKIPNTVRGSLWQSVMYHLPAIRDHMGIQSSTRPRDDVVDCQNIFKRYINPVFSVLPILNIVWQEIEKSHDESIERNIAIDQILMRHAVWAKDLSKNTTSGAATMIHVIRQLGIPFCDCRLVHLREPECVL